MTTTTTEDVDVTMADLIGTTASPQAMIFAALGRAQAAFPPIPKSKTIQIRAGREYSYAPLEGILSAVRAALAAEHLAVTQTFNGETLVTSLLHSGGGTIESVVPVPRGELGWQEWGSAITYARRYALTAILGVAPEDDDDAASAAAPPAEKKPDEPRMVSKAQHAKIGALIKSLDEAQVPLPADYEAVESWVDVVKQHAWGEWGVTSRKDLTVEQASGLIDWLEEQAIPF